MHQLKNDRGMIPVLEVVLIVGVAVVVGVAAYLYGSHKASKTAATPSPTPKVAVASATPTPKVDPYAGWKTYTSKTEKSSFKYPADWKLTQSTLEADQGDGTVTLTSPSGAVKIGWVSILDGIGGACEPDIPVTSNSNTSSPCPQTTILDKTPVNGAAGQYAVVALVTNDGKTYTPTILITSSSVSTATSRDLFFGIFKGKNNGKLGARFGTDMAQSNLTQAQATAYLAKPEMVIAKQIVQSYSY